MDWVWIMEWVRCGLLVRSGGVPLVPLGTGRKLVDALGVIVKGNRVGNVMVDKLGGVVVKPYPGTLKRVTATPEVKRVIFLVIPNTHTPGLCGKLF